MKRRSILVTLILVFAALPLWSQLAREGLYTDHSLGGGINPQALGMTSRLWYRIPLNEQRGVLWDPAKLDIGIRNQLSPAFEELGAYLYWEPLALFDFTATVAARQTITAFDAGFYELSGYDAGYRNLSDSGSDSARTGYRFTFAPRLKAAYRGFVAVNELKIDIFDFGSNVADPGERYFYEPAYDTVLAFRDTVVANTAMILYTVRPTLRFGVQYYLRHIPGADRGNHRVAGIGVLAQPIGDQTLLYAALLAGSYIADRYHQGAPFVAGQVGIQLRLTEPRGDA